MLSSTNQTVEDIKQYREPESKQMRVGCLTSVRVSVNKHRLSGPLLWYCCLVAETEIYFQGVILFETLHYTVVSLLREEVTKLFQ